MLLWALKALPTTPTQILNVLCAVGFRSIRGNVYIRAGASSKIWASQGSKMIFSKMPPFSSWHIPRHKSLTVGHDLMSFGGCRLFNAIFPLFSVIYFSVTAFSASCSTLATSITTFTHFVAPHDRCGASLCHFVVDDPPLS